MLPNSDIRQIIWLAYLLPPASFDVWSFFKEIFALQKWDLKKIDIYLHFQGQLWQELDDQTQCDHFGENFMKIGWMVLEIFNVFFIFPCDIFNLEMETKLFGKLHSRRIFYRPREPWS